MFVKNENILRFRNARSSRYPINTAKSTLATSVHDQPERSPLVGSMGESVRALCSYVFPRDRLTYRRGLHTASRYITIPQQLRGFNSPGGILLCLILIL
jgi:hypothetical protein